MGLVIFGALGDFIAFALAPQTVVTPVGSFTLGASAMRVSVLVPVSVPVQVSVVSVGARASGGLPLPTREPGGGWAMPPPAAC